MIRKMIGGIVGAGLTLGAASTAFAQAAMVKAPDVAAQQRVQPSQSRQSPNASSGDYERDFLARDVPTFGGTRERFQPGIGPAGDAAQDTIDASTVSERQKKLLQMKQSETQFTLPRDLQGVLADIAWKLLRAL